MLSASALKSDRTLENFIMFLRLHASEQTVSEGLKTRFFSALSASTKLLGDPDSISDKTTAEAVSLAATMLRDPVLHAVLQELDEKKPVPKETAQSALDRMDISYADGGQSPNFGETVFAVM